MAAPRTDRRFYPTRHTQRTPSSPQVGPSCRATRCPRCASSPTRRPGRRLPRPPHRKNGGRRPGHRCTHPSSRHSLSSRPNPSHPWTRLSRSHRSNRPGRTRRTREPQSPQISGLTPPQSVTLAEAPRTTLEGQQVIGITGNFPQDGTIGGPRPSTSRTQAPAPSPDRLRRKRRPRHHHPDALGRAALAHATSEFDARQQPQRLTPAAVTSTLTELRVRELSTVACRAEQQRLALGSGGFQLDPRGAFSG